MSATEDAIEGALVSAGAQAVSSLLDEMGFPVAARALPAIMDILATRFGPSVLRAHVNRIELARAAADAAELAKFGPEEP